MYTLDMSRSRPGERDGRHVADETCGAALLLVDVVNAFEFEGAQRLVRRARSVARRVADLRARAARAGVPVIYVNDNFGRWRSDFKSMVRHCARRDAPGRSVTRMLAPSSEDYFVLKPYNSGFFCTALESLLEQLGATTLVLVGIATDNCVLFTAHDAYLRGYRLFVPRDCCVADTDAHHAQALAIIERTMKADTRPASRLRLASIARAITPDRDRRAGAESSRARPTRTKPRASRRTSPKQRRSANASGTARD